MFINAAGTTPPHNRLTEHEGKDSRKRCLTGRATNRSEPFKEHSHVKTVVAVPGPPQDQRIDR